MYPITHSFLHEELVEKLKELHVHSMLLGFIVRHTRFTYITAPLKYTPSSSSFL